MRIETAYTVRTSKRVYLNTDDLNEARAFLSNRRCPSVAYIQYNVDAIEEVNDVRSDIASETFDAELPVFVNEDHDDRALHLLTPAKLREYRNDYTYEVASRSPKMPYLRRGMANTRRLSQFKYAEHKKTHKNGII